MSCCLFLSLRSKPAQLAEAQSFLWLTYWPSTTPRIPSLQGIFVKKMSKANSDPANHFKLENKIALGDILIQVPAPCTHLVQQP